MGLFGFIPAAVSAEAARLHRQAICEDPERGARFLGAVGLLSRITGRPYFEIADRLAEVVTPAEMSMLDTRDGWAVAVFDVLEGLGADALIPHPLREAQ